MPRYTIKKYRQDSILLREGLRNKRPIHYIIKKHFTDYKGDRKKLRLMLQNCLNGNSYEKTKKLRLMPIFKKMYFNITGNMINEK